MKKKEIVKLKSESINLFQKTGIFFFDKKLFTTLLWLSLVVFGAMSYATLMKREGFPAINIPIGLVQIQTFSDSSKFVDQTYAQPLVEILNKDDTVKSVSVTSTQNGSTLVITFNDTNDVQPGLDRIQESAQSILPSDTKLSTTKINPGKFTNEGEDLLISVHAKSATPEELDRYASELVVKMADVGGLIDSARAIYLVQAVTNPANGQEVRSQTSFDRFFSENTDEVLPSSIVAVKGVEGADQLELFDQVEALIEDIQFDNQEVRAEISANFAESIREQVGSLQKNLLEGLLVVLLVSFILISIRASVITALAMTTTVTITVGVLNLIGYSLNTITLFSLILCLALIVDDTTIVVESMDAGLKDKKATLRRIAVETLGKVARATTTGTLVTILAFAPMLFISGILGEFIRAIPVTIIISLIVSLLVSLFFIPLMMRLSFFGKERPDHKKRRISFVDRFEKGTASVLSRTVSWSTAGLRRRSILTKLGSVVIGTSFLVAGFVLFSQVGFNIFPSPKDGNQIIINAQVRDLESANIDKTQELADLTLENVKQSIGDKVEKITISSATPRSFSATVYLVDYDKRSTTSVEISESLNSELQSSSPELTISVAASGVGPPASSFIIQLRGENEEQVRKLASDMKTFLSATELKRLDGTSSKIKEVSVSPSVITRRSAEGSFIEVTAEFKDTDTTTLVLLAQTTIDNEFNAEKLASYGLDTNAVQFDLGQEQENQDSFSSMGKAALPLFVVMFIVMALLFKSVLQPILIFTALPFAFFGVALGLFVTDNVISFFSMLGVFALIGISLNNTILLTDYANAAQKRGMSASEAMSEAIRERLRPLLTTSITSVLALLPLALNDPFWEGLAFTLIFGLISSTILVLIVFPYYYLIAESFRIFWLKIYRKIGKRVF